MKVAILGLSHSYVGILLTMFENLLSTNTAKT
jgi:hypothetical protein